MTDNRDRARYAREWLRADVIEECAGGNHATEKAIVRRESGEFLGEAHGRHSGLGRHHP